MSQTETMKIAFQGEAGAFSHQACREVYPDMEPLPCPTFEAALEAVRMREAELAMMPIENSLYGRVADLHRLLPDSGLYAIGEHFVPIRLQLLGLPGAKLDQITEAQTHMVALGQCRKFLGQHDIAGITGADTAGSAREVRDAGIKTRAAISSSLAGEIYNLDVLASDIEDMDHNTTRFLVLSRRRIEADPTEGRAVTSFLFEVRNVPAALYKALGGFATNGVNMNKLESFMLGGSFTATRFYAEIEGHPDDPAIARALDELQFYCKSFKIMGVFPMHPRRVAE
ncbi:MAG: prephenate dehydratase [Pseudomonadota bacterium]